MLSNNLYDVLKWVAQYFLPGLAAFYAALCQVWPLPFCDQIVGTIVALDALLGLMLGITNNAYKKSLNKAIVYEPIAIPLKADVTITEVRRTGIFIRMTNETYDVLVWIANVGLPAIGTFVFALYSLWGFPYGGQIVGTIAAIDTFLGIVLGVSTAQYNDDLLMNRISTTR